MVVSDRLFEAYLKCKTKAYQLFFADATRIRSLDSISEWQQQIKDDFCRAYVNTLVSGNCNWRSSHHSRQLLVAFPTNSDRTPRESMT